MWYHLLHFALIHLWESTILWWEVVRGHTVCVLVPEIIPMKMVDVILRMVIQRWFPGTAIISWLGVDVRYTGIPKKMGFMGKITINQWLFKGREAILAYEIHRFGAVFVPSQHIPGCCMLCICITVHGQKWFATRNDPPSSIPGWWFQMFFIFHFIYGMSSFPLTNSIIFQDGEIAPPTRSHVLTPH